MTYSQKVVREVFAYLDEGYSYNQAVRHFGISKGCISYWRNNSDKVLRRAPSSSLRYPDSVVKKALGLAYGSCGMKLNEVALLFGISASTIASWKKKYMVGGKMDIPEIDPDEIERISDMQISKMSDSELKSYIHKLELKSAVLESTVKVLKAEGIEDLTCDERAAIVDALPKRFSVKAALTVVGLSSSSYYYCKSKSIRPDRYQQAREAIRKEFALVKGKRGYRYIRQRLRERKRPIILSGKTVRRLMAEEGCKVSYHRKKHSYNSYKGEISRAPDNLVARNFYADRPNKLWLTDITQFNIPAGKIYLSPIIDCFDGMPVSWKIGISPNAALANSMLEEECIHLAAGEHPICHSDRGCHYRWPGWIQICKEHGIIRSMSKKGCSPDNSACEGFFGRLKNEFFYGQDWKGVSIKKFIQELDDYMRYYRDKRIKESLGWKSPAQYRQSLGLAV